VLPFENLGKRNKEQVKQLCSGIVSDEHGTVKLEVHEEPGQRGEHT